MPMNNKQLTITAISAVILILFAIFVWPTRYVYTHMNVGDGASLLIRIDRFTGKTEWFNPNVAYGGWKGVSPTPTSGVPIISGSEYDKLYKQRETGNPYTNVSPMPSSTFLPFTFEPPSEQKKKKE